MDEWYGGLTLKDILNEKGLSISVGDEGGFAPNLKTSEQVLDLIIPVSYTHLTLPTNREV